MGVIKPDQSTSTPKTELSRKELCETFPNFSPKKYTHVYQLLDAWSIAAHTVVPIPRRPFVLYHSAVTLETQLGKGAFGEVFKGKYLPKEGTEPIEVAVKRAIGDANKGAIQECCHEVQIMSELQHPNVVCLYGIASLETPIMLVMELVAGGDLKKYLRNTPFIPCKQLILFAIDIASGMKYLASKNIIHRDLAARNCLITKAGQVKISDFGLSIEGPEVIVKKLKKAPIRWLAPETLLKGIFNEKTDVWSFGVLVTELMSRCAADPLSPRNLREVQKWIKESDHPHRVENPDPKELGELVDYCCDKNTSTRPTFHMVRRRLKVYLGLGSGSLETKKSDERKSGGSTERRLSNTTLTRKKSRDGRLKDRSTERRTGTQRRSVFSRKRKDKKEKGALKLPTGMNTNQEKQPSPPVPSTVSPTTPPIQKPPPPPP
ncbi:hypothetical protein CAEBREN_22076 [Caenorhabditis brenneri]|uniref:Protein kinase domain-containing protein n=1 Tax=Caenorhabditis brenneri TaxID=135651 RepID=G0ME03_CAEBE|nr:hypothetical protein CAEBREN_22076 [Caenorhabditis brenneri]